MTAIRCLLACCFLWVALPVWAGVPAEGHSGREGVFYAYFNLELDDGTKIGSDTFFGLPGQAIALRNHCERGGFVFSHRNRARYGCKVHLPSGEYEYGSIEIIGAPADPHYLHYGLFTTQPVRGTQWKVRPLSADELAGIVALIETSPGRYGNLGKYVASGKAFAVHKAEGKLTAYFVPGQWIRGEFYEAQRHHVFVGREGSYRYQGQLVDKPARYYDLDGDDLPEVETNESCDGLCISLWDISRAPEEIASWGGH